MFYWKIQLVISCVLVFGQHAIIHSVCAASTEGSNNKNSSAVSARETSPSNDALPTFDDYPSNPFYDGAPAKLVLDSDFAKSFRTRLRKALSDKPSFAGEYVITGWGCGTSGCVIQCLVNKRTGKAIETDFLAYSVMLDDEEHTEIRVGEMIVEIKIDSRLLIAKEVTTDKDGNPDKYFLKYYIVENDKLKLLKKIKLPQPKK